MQELTTLKAITSTKITPFFATCPTGYSGIDCCIDIGIDGYLNRFDALKIYELAYYGVGGVLELGTYKGLSASIIAQALDNSGRAAILETVDTDEAASAVAKETLAGRQGAERIRFNIDGAAEFMDKRITEGQSFGFVFIDHDHRYTATAEAAERLHDIMNPGGFCLFHDFNDPSNADPCNPNAVYQAVADTILFDDGFEFYGVFGCCGLFRKMDS